VGVWSAAGLATNSSLARARPLAGRLSLGALGLTLVLLVSAAWGTGVFYLLARLGTGSPVGLASMDGVHVYVGLVGAVFVVAKVARVGLRYRVEGVPSVVPWHRWMSWSLLVLYGAVFVTGVLALLPIRGRVANDIVDLHLLTSVWALVPTTWHVWHYRARALPYLRRWTRRPAGWRFWSALVLVALPTPALVAGAAAVSLLPEVLGGASWSPAALRGSYLHRIATSDGALIAAGDALYTSRDGVVWERIDLPVGAAGPAPPAGAPAGGGHEHGQPAPAGSITALAVGGDGTIFVGSAQGLFRSPGLDGPLERVPFGGGAVSALCADPADAGSLWVASAGGPLVTADGGRTWSSAVAGLEQPGSVAAIACAGGNVFASDTLGVYRWDAGRGSWARSSRQLLVADLTTSPDGRELYAASPTAGIQALGLPDGRWTRLEDAAPIHNHGGHLHGQPSAVAPVDGRLYAAGTAEGVSASADGGRTWTQLGGGLGEVTPAQVIGFRGSLLAATSGGLYRFPLRTAPPASPGWWLALIAAALAIGLVAAALGAPGPAPRRSRIRRG
jgi:hypothetical protein